MDDPLILMYFVENLVPNENVMSPFVLLLMFSFHLLWPKNGAFKAVTRVYKKYRVKNDTNNSENFSK